MRDPIERSVVGDRLGAATRIHLVRRLALVLLAAGLTAIGPAAAPGHTGGCGSRLPTAPRGVPWQIVIRTSCGAFVVRSSGKVEHRAVRPWAPSWVPVNASRPLPGTYMTRRHNYITLFRAGRVLWRSARPYPYTSSIAVGLHAVAWSTTRRDGTTGLLYLARIGGAERRIGVGEDPLGFTRSGTLVTERWRGGSATLFLRHRDGAFATVLARGVRAAAFDPDSWRILFVAPGRRLLSFDGPQSRLLGRTAFSAGDWLQPIGGGLVGVFGSDGVRIFRAVGGFFASAPLRPPTRRRGRSAADGPGLVGSPRGDAAAFATAWRPSVEVYRGVGTVWLLRPGDRHATALYRNRVRL